MATTCHSHSSRITREKRWCDKREGGNDIAISNQRYNRSLWKRHAYKINWFVARLSGALRLGGIFKMNPKQRKEKLATLSLGEIGIGGPVPKDYFKTMNNF